MCYWPWRSSDSATCPTEAQFVSMYLPGRFRETDRALIYEAIAAYPFATLVTPTGHPDGVIVSHVPLVLDAEAEGGRGALLGHVARANPHSRVLTDGAASLAIFHGPHTYISPRWYLSRKNVPTWNYLAIHIHGTAQVIHDRHALRQLFGKMVSVFEAGAAEPWSVEQAEDEVLSLLDAIMGFVLPIERVEAKAKMSQNRALGDREEVVRHLEQSADPGEQAVAAWMRRYLG